MTDTLLNLHAFLARSRANGPGCRSVVWFQGCTLGCPGCFNPESHEAGAGECVEVGDLVRRILAVRTEIEGVTLSGGEPFQQARALVDLLCRLRDASDLSVLVFSGYTLGEIRGQPLGPVALDLVDVLVAGRYVATRRQARGLVGSTNQEIHCLTDRHRPGDLRRVPPTEVHIDPRGDVTVTGVDDRAGRVR